MRYVLLGILLAAVPLIAQRQVQVRLETLTLLTDIEGAPEQNAYFDQFAGSQLIYPYSKRISFTNVARPVAWRALTLENEYLRCTVLPDVGGHLYGCLDKLSGKQMFYNNPDLRWDWISLRGAWAAFGIELNFPVAHSWVTVSPVDFAAAEMVDGAGSVWVANTDRVTGMRWNVEFVLRPGAALLEQVVTLENRTPQRRRYYWWANAEVREEDRRTSFVFPTYLMAPHDFSQVFTWPSPRAGLDLTEVGNFAEDASYFTHGSREPFFAAYQPTTRLGVAHYADPAEVPGKKLWTWGPNDYPRRTLSRDGSKSIEIQAGLFENQQTFGYLAPFETRRFTEYWMPVRDLGGVTRSELAGTLYAKRDSAGTLQVEFQANRVVNGARLAVAGGGRTLLDEEVTLDPERHLRRTLNGAGAPPFTVRITAGGRTLLEHVEDKWNATTAAEDPPGPRSAASWATKPQTEEEYMLLGSALESQWRPELAESAYRAGLEAFPGSGELWKAAGRLSLLLTRPEEALTRLRRPELDGDAEARYYAGLAQELLGDDAAAKALWESVLGEERWRKAAGVMLAYLESRAGSAQRGLDVLGEGPGGGLRVSLLRRAGRMDAAFDLLFPLRSADPADLLLRHEEVLLGGEDDALWRHLSADPERVLDLVDHYLRLGAFDDARGLLERIYPDVKAEEAEPKTVRPQEHPLVLYYRAFVREKLGRGGVDDYPRASRAALEYVFPARASSLRVFEAALRQNTNDASARFLLGCLLLHFRKTDEAIAEWQKVRTLAPSIATLHRNLGRVLLDVKKDPRAAFPVLEEGLKYDPRNEELVDAYYRARAMVQ
ncbi:MAG: DUF5107 domain-containing protein [Bryobacteraceae bacterium]